MKTREKYIYWLLILIIFAISYSVAYIKYILPAEITYRIYMPHYIFMYFSHVLFGIIIGLPLFYKEFKIYGRWRINILKLAIIGIPSFLLSNIVFYSIIALLTVFHLPANLMIHFRILLGYTVITSFYKESSSNQEDR